jgi:uncharacterized protein DUF4384
MTTSDGMRSTERWRTQGIVMMLLGPIVLSSCAAAPFLIPVAFEFARNLFQTGLQNYGSKHRDNLSNLVNRLASPYMQNLPPTAMGGPGFPGQQGFSGQPGFPGQPGLPQQQFPGQQMDPAQTGVFDPNNPSGMPAGAGSFPGGPAAGFPGQPGIPQQQYPGQQSFPGQAGGYDPNNPYGSAGTTYPGANAYPGTAPGSLYGQQQTNPYGAPSPYGQQPNPYGASSSNPYGGQNPYGSSQPYGTQNPYGGTGYPPQSGQPNPYGSTNPYGGGGAAQGYGQPPAGYGQAQPGYDPNNPYGAGGTAQGYGQAQPGYGTQQAQQAYGGYGAGGQQQYGGQPYGGAGIYPRSVSSEPVAVDVAMIRQKKTAKGKEVVLMNDGEVLRDGGTDKEAGDRFKIVVRTNCDCYLYITTIDGSGWAEPVFPTKDGKTPNPVMKDQEYAFPEGPRWFSLDQVKGIETFYVVASVNRRTDLEESMAALAAETRPPVKIVAKVEEPPVIPRGVGSAKPRGIITVSDDTGTAVQVTPLSYAAGQSGQDVTVTRWFKHE